MNFTMLCIQHKTYIFFLNYTELLETVELKCDINQQFDQINKRTRKEQDFVAILCLFANLILSLSSYSTDVLEKLMCYL